MHGLDEIPWHSLQHAYGTAEDVPELLRQLQTAEPNTSNENSPLWHLFGNIWHQGTVYEATSYAVPFLIKLAEDPATPDRVGILGLLAAIARGSSYLEVHEDFLRKNPVEKLGTPGTAEFENEKAQELNWVASAHSAVAEGYETYTALSGDQSDVAYAAANVLACLRVRPSETSRHLLDMLQNEPRSQYRAGLLLLIAEHANESAEIRSRVAAAASAESLAERRAAAIATARLRSIDISPPLREALIDAICDEDLDSHFDGLPWYASENIDRDALIDRDPSAAEAVVARLLASAEAGTANEESYCTLCELLFRHNDDLEPDTLTLDQQRALNAIVDVIDSRRISFRTPLSCFGLPDSRRQLRKLAAGHSVDLEIDEKLPVIGDPSKPAKPLALWRLKPGNRIHSRYFGLGTIIEVTRGQYDIVIVVDFDEEGRKTLGIIDSPPRYLADAARYVLSRLLGRN